MKWWRRYTVQIVLILLSFVFVATLAGWKFYTGMVEKREWNELFPDKKYERHYVMIPDDSSSLIWQDIYRGAREEALAGGACLELLGDWDSGNYEVVDYIGIAVASKVDGIIVKPDGTAKMREAINAAEKAGIPVITVLEDDSASDRHSFVGVNSYQMGTIYGNQILSCIDSDSKKVTVLLNRGDAGKDLVYKQIRTTVQEGLAAGQSVTVESQTITRGSSFGAEERIRDLLQDEAKRPDILVCLNETDSECAYYAVVDYNQVESVRLIGYYQSEGLLRAVQKGVIPIVVTLDAAQAGKCCVGALEELYSMGYASSYISVDLNIITKENVQDYLDTETEKPGSD